MVWLYFPRSDLVQFCFPLWQVRVSQNSKHSYTCLSPLGSVYINPILINSRPGQGAGEILKSAQEGGVKPSCQRGSAIIRAVVEAIGLSLRLHYS